MPTELEDDFDPDYDQDTDLFEDDEDGGDEEVTQPTKGELLHADYTRKMQKHALDKRALESERAELRQALALIQNEQARLEDEELSPAELTAKRTEAKVEALVAEAAADRLQAQILKAATAAGLTADSDDDLTADVLDYMVANEIGKATVAVKLMKAELAEGKRAGKTNAKRTAAPVASGSSRTPTSKPATINTVADAFYAAKRQLNL